MEEVGSQVVDSETAQCDHLCRLVEVLPPTGLEESCDKDYNSVCVCVCYLYQERPMVTLKEWTADSFAL